MTTLLEAVTSNNLEEELTAWFKKKKIKVKKTGEHQYKVLNGCHKNIMFYPTKFKLMFQDGRNYVIECREERTLVGLINGDVPFKRGEE
jgi:hypothetical protein